MKGSLYIDMRPGEQVHIGDAAITIIRKTGNNLIRIRVVAPKEIPVNFINKPKSLIR